MSPVCSGPGWVRVSIVYNAGLSEPPRLKGSLARRAPLRRASKNHNERSSFRSRRGRGRPGPPRIPHLRDGGHRCGGRGVRRGALHRFVESLRACPRRRRAGRGGPHQARAGPDGSSSPTARSPCTSCAARRKCSSTWRATMASSRIPNRRIPSSRSTRATPRAAAKPEILVLDGTCTHLGCLPKSRFEAAIPELGADWPGGFFCPCHGSRFDLSGRVFEGSPASTNLRIPDYSFRDDTDPGHRRCPGRKGSGVNGRQQ